MEELNKQVKIVEETHAIYEKRKTQMQLRNMQNTCL